MTFNASTRHPSDARHGANDVFAPDTPFCAPGCCVDACVVRTGFLELCDETASRATGGELAALEHSDLRERFWCWRSETDARFVCSVFPVEQESIVAEFSDVVIVGVARTGTGPQPLCLIEARAFGTPEGLAVRAQAHAAGCTEWHVYFEDEPGKVRDFAALFRL